MGSLAGSELQLSEAVGRHKSTCPIIMRLIVLLFCAFQLSAVSSQPSPFLSWLTSNYSDTFISLLPESAKVFVNNTVQDGKEVVYDIYDDVREEIINKTTDNLKVCLELLVECLTISTKS